MSPKEEQSQFISSDEFKEDPQSKIFKQPFYRIGGIILLMIFAAISYFFYNIVTDPLNFVGEGEKQPDAEKQQQFRPEYKVLANFQGIPSRAVAHSWVPSKAVLSEDGSRFAYVKNSDLEETLGLDNSLLLATSIISLQEYVLIVDGEVFMTTGKFSQSPITNLGFLNDNKLWYIISEKSGHKLYIEGEISSELYTKISALEDSFGVTYFKFTNDKGESSYQKESQSVLANEVPIALVAAHSNLECENYVRGAINDCYLSLNGKQYGPFQSGVYTPSFELVLSSTSGMMVNIQYQYSLNTRPKLTFHVNHLYQNDSRVQGYETYYTPNYDRDENMYVGARKSGALYALKNMEIIGTHELILPMSQRAYMSRIEIATEEPSIFAYSVNEIGNERDSFAVFNGQAQESFDEVSNLNLSSEGKYLAYVATEERLHKTKGLPIVVVNGFKSDYYEYIYRDSLIFTDATLEYLAVNRDKELIHVTQPLDALDMSVAQQKEFEKAQDAELEKIEVANTGETIEIFVDEFLQDHLRPLDEAWTVEAADPDLVKVNTGTGGYFSLKGLTEGSTVLTITNEDRKVAKNVNLIVLPKYGSVRTREVEIELNKTTFIDPGYPFTYEVSDKSVISLELTWRKTDFTIVPKAAGESTVTLKNTETGSTEIYKFTVIEI